MKNLTNRTALVTGGSRGIGAAIAKRLAKEGANVAITYNASQQKAEEVIRAIEAQGVKGLAIKADSADAKAVQAAVDLAAKELGGLHILVNNAGVAEYKLMEEFTIEEYDFNMNVNVKAVFFASQAALRYLGRGGRIINIGTCMVDKVAFPGATVYSMSKTALTGLTKGLARELGKRGITVNLVHPGPIDTDMNPVNGESADFQRTLLAVDNFGTGDDIAGLVAYLAGDESKNITGTGITIDGGTNI
ncbi:SDR family NAD(P)-dependent oxidoreductase [Chitinophaga sp. XS-30]|uniref:SDR family NAD(P)-dependent oxidoreductase n=1 Tax=Chitinophaga sp. XS-30 TaxID=2604421 RepID=UPI0011DCB558|nr:3-oxoacyl-ACP reductase family protein [Chitinophaga sp. XS-30]QEH39554.1 3-oxoacyl-ACP reductase FabG [Chitinophaga sp. XS-30]